MGRYYPGSRRGPLMNALRASLGRNGRFFVVVAVLFGVAAWGLAVEPDKDPSKTEPKKEAPKEPEKGAIKFEMDQKPWKDVLTWISEKTELPLYGDYPKTGTFTSLAPKGKTYTLPEIFDIINDGLLAREETNRYILIRSERKLVLIPADKDIDPAVLPVLRSKEELESHGT